MIPSLYVLCLDQIVAHIEKVVSLQGVPEEPVLQLFARVFSRPAIPKSSGGVFCFRARQCRGRYQGAKREALCAMAALQ
jgi:hypothetical protein